MEELFRLHNVPLWHYLRRMLGRDDVTDLQQEVWLSVLRGIARLKSPEAFVVWFYRIARSKAFTRPAGGPTHRSLDADGPLEPTAVIPEPEFTAADTELIRAGLGHLSPEHREVIVLRYMEDLSYEQIAAIAGCTTGTVRSRLHYAKLALRPHLETKP